MIYTVTIRAGLDTSELKVGGAQASAEMDKVAVAGEKSARRQMDAFGRMYATIDAGRQQFVTSQIAANEATTKSLVANTIKAGSETSAQMKAVAATAEATAAEIAAAYQVPIETAIEMQAAYERMGEVITHSSLEITSAAGVTSAAIIRQSASSIEATEATNSLAAAETDLTTVQAALTAMTAEQIAVRSALARQREVETGQVEAQVASQSALITTTEALIPLTEAEAAAWAQLSKDGALLGNVEASLVAVQLQHSEVLALETEANLALSKAERLSINANIDARKAELATMGTRSAATEVLESYSATTLVTTAALVALIAVILALGVALVKITEFSVTGAEKFGEYGEEIAKLHVKTQITTEALSGLLLVAKETGTSADQLAVAFSRLEINIEKGITKPTGQAGLALKTLGINLEEIKHMTPTEQVAKVTAALNGLENQNVKTAVSAALMGKGFQQLSPALAELGGSLAEQQKLAAKFNLEFSPERTAEAHEYTIAQRNLTLAWEGFQIEVGERAIPELTIAFERLADVLAANGETWRTLGDIAATTIRELRVGASFLVAFLESVGHPKSVLDLIPNVAIIKGLVAGGKAFADENDRANKAALDYETKVTKLAGLENEITNQKRMQKELTDKSLSADVRTAKEAGLKQVKDNIAAYRRELNLPDTGTGGPDQMEVKAQKAKAAQTELGRLTKEYQKLTDEVNALHDAGSAEFELKYKVEGLQKLKGDLENILKIRYEIGLPLDAPLAEKPADVAAQLRFAQQQKSAFEEVRKATEAQGQADAHLAALRITSTMQVVDVQTRADTRYLEGIIARRNAEKDLSAEILSDARLRADAEKDFANQQVNGYNRVRLAQGKSIDQLRAQLAEDSAFNQAFINEDPLRAAAKAQAGIQGVSKQLDPALEAAARMASIDTNVAAIAAKITGAPPAMTPGAGVYSVGGQALNPDGGGNAAYSGADAAVKGGLGIVSIHQKATEAIKETTAAEVEYGDQVEKVATLESRNGIVQQTQEAARLTAIGAREAATRSATTTIANNEALLAAGLTSLEGDIALMRSNKQVERMRSERQAVVEIQSLNDDLADIERGDVQAIGALQANAEKQRLSGRVQLKQQIVSLEDEIAHAGEDSADRYRVAQLTAIRAVQDADVKARESMIASQIQIADQSVFHAEQARAGILEAMAKDKGITGTFQDAFLGTIDAVSGALDKTFDKITSKLGIFGGVVKQILTDLTRMAVDRVFRTLLDVVLPGAGSGGGGGAGGTGAGGILAGLLGSLSRGGAGAGGTGGFAGGSGAAGLLSVLAAGGGGLGNLGASVGNRASSSGSLGSLIGTGAGGAIGNSDIEKYLYGGIAPPAQSSNLLGSLTGLVGSPFGLIPGGATAAGGGAGIGGLLSGLGGSLGAMAPLLGIGLGASLGGQSKLGQILGGAGGLLGGGIIGALTGTGIFAGGGIAGAGGALAFLPALLTNPITLIAAPLIIAAAVIIAKNKQRQEDEKKRNQASIDTRTAIYDLLGQAQRGEVTVTQAKAQWEQIHQNYLQSISGIKDGKTKRNALLWWDYVSGTAVDPGGATEAIWPKIEAAAKAGEVAAAFKTAFVPTYSRGMTNGLVPDTGGMMTLIKVRPGERIDDVGAQHSWTVPGFDTGADTVMTLASPGSAVRTRDQQRVPGFAKGSGNTPIVQDAGSDAPIIIIAFTPEHAQELLKQVPHAVVADLVSENIINTDGGALIGHIARSLKNRGYSS